MQGRPDASGWPYELTNINTLLKGDKMETRTQEQEATFQTVLAIAEAIRSLGTVPSGHLYARVMGKLSLDQYNQIIGMLKRQGLISETHYELKWIA